MKIKYLSLISSVIVGLIICLVVGCDTFVARTQLVGKWKTLDGSTIEFFSDKTVQYIHKGKTYDIPGKWRTLEKGRVIVEIIDSNGFREVDVGILTKNKLNTYSLVIDINGITKIFNKIE